MKENCLKKLLLILLCLVLFLGTSKELILAFSKEPIIYYDGRKKEVSFVNVQQEDLFPNFKDVMPGDIQVQQLRLQGENIQNMTDVYLNVTRKDNTEIPRGIYLNIYIGDTMKLECELSECKTQTEQMLLHRFYQSESVELKVVLVVSNSVGNEISDLKTQLDWSLVILEEGSVVPPKTGDAAIPVRLVIVNVCSLSMLLWILIKKTKTSKIDGRRNFPCDLEQKQKITSL